MVTYQSNINLESFENSNATLIRLVDCKNPDVVMSLTKMTYYYHYKGNTKKQ